jgi:DNA transformation protein
MLHGVAAMITQEKLRNIGPKSAAWLRQVGLRTREDLEALGAVAAFMRVKRAGFKPSLNLLYALEGALLDCHWQEVPEARRTDLVTAAEAAIALLPLPRGRPPAGPVTTTMMAHEEAIDAGAGFDTANVFDAPEASD